MLFTTVSMAFFAALASAHAHHPQHFHNRRHLNGTATGSGSGQSTTLTVYATSVYTVTSCAPTITNCPASTGAAVVTDIIAITTTVCPIEQAESASSAIQSSYSASATNSANGALTTPSVPLSTGNSGPAPTEGASGEESVVLTYTLGTGTSTTVVTTTVRHTSTSTVYATLPGHSGGESPAVTGETPTPTGEAEGAVTGNEAVVEPEKTTTYTGTSTSTRYITVVASPSGAGAGSGAGSGAYPTGASEGALTEGASCVPVTVTVALSTVTVTETATPTPASGAEGSFSSLPVNAADVEPTPAASDEGAVATDAPEVIYSTQTVQPLPVTTGAPYGNGTESGAAVTTSKTTTTYPSFFPSGFISKTKYAIPTGY